MTKKLETISKGTARTAKILPFTLKGHPVTMKIRRNLELMPGNYTARHGPVPDHPLISGQGVEFVVMGLESGAEYKILPVKIHKGKGDIHLDFELTFDAIGGLGERVQFQVFHQGKLAGVPHLVDLTDTKLQEGASAVLERVIRLVDTVRPG